jgi:nitrogen fixation NifU-like protein
MNLDELYQTVILEHAQNPRNYGELPQATALVESDNVQCGDEITVYVKLSMDGSRIEDIKFKGSGCAISRAAASLMAIQVKGKTPREALALATVFHEMMTAVSPPSYPVDFEELKIFENVRKFPQRVKCAVLCWYALKQALEESSSRFP